MMPRRHDPQLSLDHTERNQRQERKTYWFCTLSPDSYTNDTLQGEGAEAGTNVNLSPTWRFVICINTLVA